MNEKGFALVPLIITLAVVAAAGGYLVFQKVAAPECDPGSCQEMEQAHQIATNWQTYRNEPYGFEFRYPRELMVTETGDSSLNPNVVYTTNPKQGLFDGDQPADRLLVKINPGSTCVTEDWRYSGVMNWKTACIDGNPDYFLIMSALSEESQSVFDQIFSTFKFISPR